MCVILTVELLNLSKTLTDFACFKGHSFLLFTEITDGLPVVIMDRKPLTISRPNIDIYGTKVIVLLVS